MIIYKIIIIYIKIKSIKMEANDRGSGNKFAKLALGFGDTPDDESAYS